MPTPTIAVTCAASDQGGESVAGGIYTAKLDQTEIYDGLVVPEQVTATADADGLVILNLWPNALGVNGSSYRITARNPDTGKKFFDASVVVPNNPCNLYQIIQNAPFPNVDSAQQALIDVQGLVAAANLSWLTSGDNAQQTAADRLQTGEDRTAARESAAEALVSEQEAGQSAAGILSVFSATTVSDAKLDVDHITAIATSTALTATDRMGATKRTLAGLDADAETRKIARDTAEATARALRDNTEATALANRQAAADLVLAAAGYAPPVLYAAGISLTLKTQTVEYAGNAYAPKLADLPFTTSGAFETAKFRLIQGVAAVDLAASGGSALVGHLPSGVGALPVTAKVFFDQFVSPEHFGAVGNGIANDGPAVLAALKAACVSGKRFMGKGGATYLVDGTPMVITHDHTMPPVVIDWCGAQVILKETGFAFNGSAAFLNTSLGANVAMGDAKITLASTTGIVQGDLIGITNPAFMHGVILSLHYYLVSEVDGLDVYIEGVTCGDVNPQQIIDSGATGSIVVEVYHLNKQITFQNGHFTIVDVNGNNTALHIANHYRVVTDNCTFSGHTRNHMSNHYNGHTLATRMYFRDFGYISKDGGYASNATMPSSLGFGYGIALARNYSSVVRDVVGGHGWHVSDSARGQMHVLYENVVSHRNGYGLVSHGGVWNMTIRNCEFRGTQGTQIGGVNHLTIKGCKYRTRTHCVSYGQHITVNIVDNDMLMDNPAYTNYALFISGGVLEVAAGGRSAGDLWNVVVSRNLIVGKASLQIGRLSGEAPGTTYVEDNIFKQCEIAVFNATRVVVRGNSFNEFLRYVLSVGISPISSELLVSGNNFSGPSFSGLAEYAIRITATGAVTCQPSVIGNSGKIGNLLTLVGAMRVKVVTGNLHLGTGWLIEGAPDRTVATLANNFYAGTKVYQSPVTQDLNNVLLLA